MNIADLIKSAVTVFTDIGAWLAKTIHEWQDRRRGPARFRPPYKVVHVENYGFAALAHCPILDEYQVITMDGELGVREAAMLAPHLRSVNFLDTEQAATLRINCFARDSLD
jgi:hypothetical protein